MDFAFCINDGYAHYILVTIKSIIENNRDVEIAFHVLTDNISSENVELLKEEIKDYPHVSLNIVSVDDRVFDGLKSTWSIYAWYRILIPQLLPQDIHRILYLDADTVVCGDISYLFNMDMNGQSIAAVVDYMTDEEDVYKRCDYDSNLQYVCSGVLLMNLDYWREYGIGEKIISWARDNNDKIKFPDQDAINHVCAKSKVLLPLQYGIVHRMYYKPFFRKKHLTELIDCLEQPKIIHYAGQSPWIVEKSKHIQQEYWVKYNNLLRKPVRRCYESTGLTFVKVVIYRLLHSFKKKNNPISLLLNELKS